MNLTARKSNSVVDFVEQCVCMVQSIRLWGRDFPKIEDLTQMYALLCFDMKLHKIDLRYEKTVDSHFSSHKDFLNSVLKFHLLRM